MSLFLGMFTNSGGFQSTSMCFLNIYIYTYIFVTLKMLFQVKLDVSVLQLIESADESARVSFHMHTM